MTKMKNLIFFTIIWAITTSALLFLFPTSFAIIITENEGSFAQSSDYTDQKIKITFIKTILDNFSIFQKNIIDYMN